MLQIVELAVENGDSMTYSCRGNLIVMAGTVVSETLLVLYEVSSCVQTGVQLHICSPRLVPGPLVPPDVICNHTNYRRTVVEYDDL